MSWRDNLRAGSIGGVPVHFARRTGSGGKRLQVDEFPGSDIHTVQELGARSRSYSIECYVLGGDYDLQRDRVIEALDAKGAITLVDFWRGEREVWVESYSFEETTSQGGWCRFSLECVKQGAGARPVETVDTKAVSFQASEDVLQETVAAFERAYDVLSWPAHVAEAAADWLTDVTGLSGVLETADRLVSTAQSVSRLRARFFEQLADLRSDPLSVVRGTGLAGKITGLLEAYRFASGGSEAALGGLQNYAQIGLARPALPDTTPARQAALRNEAALNQLIARAALVSRVRAATGIQFQSRDEALILRTALTGELDAAITMAGDTAEEVLYQTLRRLKSRVVEDITTRGGSLARLKTVKVNSPLPALVLAQRLYGNADRADDLIGRNQSVHPGFMPLQLRALAE